MAAKPDSRCCFLPIYPCRRLEGRGYNLCIVDSNEPYIVSEASTVASTWMCLICGWIYDETSGDPEHGIAPGTLWADVDMNWVCPECGARKEDFEMVRI